MPDVTAVFAANDSMALGVLRALHDHGRQVPGHVSLIGFDDLPEVAYLTPGLTTVRQDFAEVGRRGLAMLVEQIESRVKGPRRVVVGTTLVVRDSTRTIDERIARTLANRRGTGSRQATIQAAMRRNTVRSFEWWLSHGSDALAPVTLGELATIYADRPGYRDHCRALIQLGGGHPA